MSAPKQVKLGAAFCDEYYKAIAISKKHNLALDVMRVVAVKTCRVQNPELITAELIPACACVFTPLGEIAALDAFDSLPVTSYEGARSQQRTKAKRARDRDALIKKVRNLAKTITITAEPIAARNARYVARMKELTGEGKTVRAASVLIHSEETAAGLVPPDAGTIKRICYK